MRNLLPRLIHAEHVHCLLLSPPLCNDVLKNPRITLYIKQRDVRPRLLVILEILLELLNGLKSIQQRTGIQLF